MEKSKTGKKSLVKKEKKTGPKKKERVPFCQEKKKIPLWKRLVLAELHAGVRTSNKEVVVKPKCVIHIHSSFSGFSIFAVGFAFACGNFAHYCVVLLNAPPNDRKRKRGVWNQEPITYVLVMGSCCNGLLFPGNLDPSSLTPGGPVVSLVWGEIICWLGASRHIWFEEEYNHFERIYRVYRSVWFSSNFAKTFQE